MALGRASTPNSIRTLRRYWKDKTALIDVPLFSGELTGTSDRARIILTAASLDDVLIFRIMGSFAFTPDENEFDHIFRFEGPLGSFSSRIEIAHLFGLIDDMTRDQLDTIREMRNACAHTRRNITFEVPELGNVARRLYYPRGVIRLANDSVEELRHCLPFETTL